MVASLYVVAEWRSAPFIAAYHDYGERPEEGAGVNRGAVDDPLIALESIFKLQRDARN